MKKILLAVTAALAITSCSQNEEFDVQNSSNEITFSTGVNNATRAVMTTNAKFAAFTTYAYTHGDETFAGTALTTLMDGVTYSRTIDGEGVAGAWTLTPAKKYYWPASGKVSFFGYAGTADENVYAKETAKMPTLTFTVKDDITTQEDLVVAQLPDQSKSESSGAVNLSFKHALTQVYFKLKAKDTDLNYEVTKIEILGAKNKGVFTYGNDPMLDADWVTSGATTGVYSIAPADQGKFTGAATVDLNDALTQTMILLPQSLDGVSIKVTYTAKDGETIIHAADKPLVWNLTGNWTPGQKIAYTLTLSGGDELTVTGGVADDSWTDKVDGNK